MGKDRVKKRQLFMLVLLAERGNENARKEFQRRIREDEEKQRMLRRVKR